MGHGTPWFAALRPRVRALVAGQLCPVAKGFPTRSAHEGLHSGMGPFVLGQILAAAKVFVTLVTLEVLHSQTPGLPGDRSLAGVGLKVAAQGGAADEALPTLLTHVAGLCAVGHLVLCQQLLVAEGGWAPWAVVGCLTHMRGQVVLQVGRPVEGLHAMATLVGSVACVDALMFTEVGAATEGLPALLTGKLLPEAVYLLVDLQGGHVAEGFVALGASVRLLSSVNGLVCHEQHAPSEGLPTLLARGCSHGLGLGGHVHPLMPSEELAQAEDLRALGALVAFTDMGPAVLRDNEGLAAAVGRGLCVRACEAVSLLAWACLILCLGHMVPNEGLAAAVDHGL